jgi:hypothetical protein
MTLLPALVVLLAIPTLAADDISLEIMGSRISWSNSEFMISLL